MNALVDVPFLRDVRFAARGLRRTPVFTLVTIWSLALALALTACIVSVVNAYSIRALPYAEPERLYHVMYAPPGPWEPRGMTGLDWTSIADVIEDPIAASAEGVNLAEGGYVTATRALRVNRGFVEGLRVRVVIGRGLADADFVAGSERPALIGYSLWRDRFGSDPGVIRRVVHGEPDSHPESPEAFHIVGVLPPGFYFGRDSAAAVDFVIPEASRIRAYMVRLRRGVSPAAAEARITEAVRRAATSPIAADWPGARLESVHERYVAGMRPALTGLTVAVALVLVIVSANVAVLMLLRSLQRQRENAVRLALGSTRRNLAGIVLAETLVLAAVALAAGLGLAAVTLRSLSPLIQTQLGRPSPSPTGIAIDPIVLGIVGGTGLLLALAVSLAPLMSRSRHLMNALRQADRVATDGASMRRLRQALIAFEIGGSLVLLIGCGLMVRSVNQMLHTDLGFDPTGLDRSRVMLKVGKYPDATAYSRFHEAFGALWAAKIGSPVAFSSWPPYVEAPSRRIETERAAANAGTIAVSPDYFSLFRIAIRQGRAFLLSDLPASSPVAIVSETLARRLWPDGQGLGRKVRVIDQTSDGLVAGPWRTVVGLSGDVRQAYDDVNRADFYTPKIPDGRYGTFYFRASGPGGSQFAALRSAAADIDPEAVVSEPRSLTADDQRLAGTRFLTLLLAGFALTAAFLAMLGIYGVTAYAVQQRHKEVAIRMALGASPRAIVGMFLRNGGLLLATGTAFGLGGGLLLSRVLHQQVFGVEPVDVFTYAWTSMLLVVAGLLAVWWPARRAAVAPPARTLNTG